MKGEARRQARNQSEGRGVSRRGVIAWFLDSTIGTAFRLVMWGMGAVLFSIVVEWVGMIFIWDVDHAQQILDQELEYLSSFNRNWLTGIYPGALAVTFLEYAYRGVDFLSLEAVSSALLGSAYSVLHFIAHGIQAAVNVVFIFCLRLAICISSITGFLLIALLGFLDGLTDREIRKCCGGSESAFKYHHAKRFVAPSAVAAFALYLTLPISIHPLMVFLPAYLITGASIYMATASFKKFL